MTKRLLKKLSMSLSLSLLLSTKLLLTTIHFQFCCSRIGDVLLKFCKFDNDVDGDNDTNHNDDNDDDNNNDDDAAAAFFQKFCRILKII